MKLYSVRVTYDNVPEVFEYLFRAKDALDVAKATGIARARVKRVRRPIQGKHIDTVVDGHLVEEGV